MQKVARLTEVGCSGELWGTGPENVPAILFLPCLSGKHDILPLRPVCGVWKEFM